MSDTDFQEKTEEQAEKVAAPAKADEAGCPKDDLPPSRFDARYNLPGPQVEPQAGWWLEPKAEPIRVPTLEEVKQEVARRLEEGQQEQQEGLGRIYPFFESQEELEQDFQQLRDDYVRRREARLPSGYLSEFVNLQKQPFGALFNTDRPQFRVDRVLEQDERLGRRGDWEYVRTGEELARLFQRETPGLYHHHALHWFLYEREDISPPRHARVWMALNLTIYSALSAAWYYKWAFNVDQGPQPRVSFAIRPYEHARDPKFVLYDFELNRDGNGSNGPETMPCPSPGTPRHPAYPSGHSTYSAAASRILEYFFSGPDLLDQPDSEVRPEIVQLRRLADNIGEARLFAGVHWIRDHRFGQLVGRAVADLVIAQLQRDCVPVLLGNEPLMKPPTEDQIRAFRERPCDNPDIHDTIPPRDQKQKGVAAAF